MNDQGFNNTEVTISDKIFVIKNYYSDIHSLLSNQDIMDRDSSTVLTIWVGCIPPPPSWTTLNTVGCVNIITNAASGGGLLRDHIGNWIVGFSVNLGSCSILEVELWELIIGIFYILNLFLMYKNFLSDL